MDFEANMLEILILGIGAFIVGIAFSVVVVCKNREDIKWGVVWALWTLFFGLCVIFVVPQMLSLYDYQNRLNDRFYLVQKTDIHLCPMLDPDNPHREVYNSTIFPPINNSKYLSELKT